jgi:hypothetical protein
MYANAVVLSTDWLNVFATVTFYDFSAFHSAYSMVIAEPTLKPGWSSENEYYQIFTRSGGVR